MKQICTIFKRPPFKTGLREAQCSQPVCPSVRPLPNCEKRMNQFQRTLTSEEMVDLGGQSSRSHHRRLKLDL